jgi:phosphatidylglycerophosphate synthase
MTETTKGASRDAVATGAQAAAANESTNGVNATREPSFLLAKSEKKALQAIARRLPRWVLPDDLTLLGIVAAAAICAAYLLSNGSDAWLWVASGLLVVHWLGDSLDGTLARVRGIQRPRYGYYLDHLVDAGATAAIAIGLGLSPHMLLSVGMLLGVAYLVLSVNVYLESQALGRFSIGYGLIGPTEVRVLLIALNTALALGLELRVEALGTGITALDVAGVALAAGMLLLLVGRARRNLRELAIEEPAAPRGPVFPRRPGGGGGVGSHRTARRRGERPALTRSAALRAARRARAEQRRAARHARTTSRRSVR